MKTVTAALALGVALVLNNMGTFTAAAQTRRVVVRDPPERLYVPAIRPTPWDYYIVPRYRYRPEDDRVDPNGPPPVPVVRYGPQESTLIWPWW